MKAIPMRNKLTGKRIAGYMWAGKGKAWTKKENYFQFESNRLISACIACATGAFWVRCKGATCKITLHDRSGAVLGTTILALPGGRKR